MRRKQMKTIEEIKEEVEELTQSTWIHVPDNLLVEAWFEPFDSSTLLPKLVEYARKNKLVLQFNMTTTGFVYILLPPPAALDELTPQEDE